MLFRKTNFVYCNNHKKHTNTLCGQNAEFITFNLEVHKEPLGLKWLTEATSLAGKLPHPHIATGYYGVGLIIKCTVGLPYTLNIM
jgi:hypothetical protein